MTLQGESGEGDRSAEQDEDEQEQRQKLYDNFRNEVDRRHLSNAENFDKTILAYSSAGLGFSLAFLKDVIQAANASSLLIIKTSWGLFAFAIFLVVVSYPVSQKALRAQLRRAERYYKERKEDAYDGRSSWEMAHEAITLASGVAFCLAMVLTTVFVIQNIDGVVKMANKRTFAQDGAIAMSMQKVSPPGPVEKGATTLPMQRVTPAPSPAPSQPPSTPQSK